MINLPFKKWTLKFYSNEFEGEYEKHQNKIRLLCFKVILCFVCIAGIACLMVFIVQQKPIYLLMMVVGIIVLSFFAMLFCAKIEAYMKQVFSIILIVGTCIYIFLEFSGIEIPHGVLGYSVGCSTMGLIQYSDNRVKVFFVFVGINVLFLVLNVFQLSMLHFVIYGYTSMIFVGSLAYMNEYTSRLSFSLNLKLSKLKVLIDEFFEEAIFAVSFDERSNQFLLELFNQQVQKILDIKNQEQMKAFLRSSYFTKEYKESTKLHGDHPKLQTLEEFLFDRIKQNNQSDYGRPLLVLRVEQNEKQNSENESKLKQYRYEILQLSKCLANDQIQIYSQINRFKYLITEQEILKRFQCMNLSVINKIRNQIIYFQKEKISNINLSYSTFSLGNYLSLINQYCHSLSAQFNRRFKLINQAFQSLELNLNSQFLTQIIINQFEWVLKQSLKHEVITLQIREEPSLNPRSNYSYVERKRDTEFNQKLLSFKIFFYHDEIIDFAKQTDATQFIIFQEVNNILLSLLGPYNDSYFNQSMNPEGEGEFTSSLQFYIYSDQTQLDPSFTNHHLKQEKV